MWWRHQAIAVSTQVLKYVMGPHLLLDAGAIVQLRAGSLIEKSGIDYKSSLSTGTTDCITSNIQHFLKYS